MNEYKYIKEINDGGYSNIYLVRNKQGYLSALKTISQKYRKFALLEIQALATVKHINIVQLYRWIEDSNYIYLELEYAQSGDLFDYRKNNTISIDFFKTIVKELCSAVQYLHNKGYVHRDIKLENILVGYHCTIKLADFGFTIHESDKSNHLCGTDGYIAPETYFLNVFNDKSIDIWATGVVIYIIATDKFPYCGSKYVMMKELERELHIPVGMDPKLQDLIKSILVPNPKERLSAEQILSHQWLS